MWRWPQYSQLMSRKKSHLVYDAETLLSNKREQFLPCATECEIPEDGEISHVPKKNRQSTHANALSQRLLVQFPIEWWLPGDGYSGSRVRQWRSVVHKSQDKWRHKYSYFIAGNDLKHLLQCCKERGLLVHPSSSASLAPK